MGKNKLQRFKENEGFPHVIQPSKYVLLNDEFKLKGNWNNFFKNDNPVILELGCGKGEYSVGLARNNPDKNYIGVDIKGARIWKGAKDSYQEKLNNVAFLRTRIDLISYCFSENEIEELWCTFSDPFTGKKKNITKRLTSSKFLNLYQKILKDKGIVHLKTDDNILFAYTLDIIKHNNLKTVHKIRDIYKNDSENIVPPIKTFYEKRWLENGKKIHYISFSLPSNIILKEPPYNHEREKLQ